MRTLLALLARCRECGHRGCTPDFHARIDRGWTR